MKRKKQANVYLIIAILLMGVVFYFSSQPYSDQSLVPWIEEHFTFNFLYQWLNDIQFHYGGQLISINQLGYAAFIEFFICKATHFILYGLLGFLWYKGIEGHMKQAFWSTVIALVVTVGYASFDELHQFYQPGRSGLLDDVILDSFGALAGIIIGRLSHSRLWKS